MTTVLKNEASERRGAPRHQFRHRVECCPLRESVGQAVTGRAHDISADGIGLVLTRWVPPESSLTVTLLDANGDPGMFTMMRVKRIRLIDRGKWMVGGVFSRKFSETELESLL